MEEEAWEPRSRAMIRGLRLQSEYQQSPYRWL